MRSSALAGVQAIGDYRVCRNVPGECAQNCIWSAGGKAVRELVCILRRSSPTDPTHAKAAGSGPGSRRFGKWAASKQRDRTNTEVMKRNYGNGCTSDVRIHFILLSSM